MTNIWSFQTANYRIAFDAYPCEDLNLSWDEDGSTQSGLDNGKFVAFNACVSVSHIPTMEVLGEDWLCECIYVSPKAFIDHRGIKTHPGCGSYFSDIVRTAISAARDNANKPRKPFNLKPTT